jgi:hypothetical protein
MLSFGLTLLMLIVATIVSIFVPHATVLYLAIMFGPGVALLTFGGILPRKHWTYGLSANQRLAIERYRHADEETKRLFPENFEQTVRNAKGLDNHGSDGIGSDRYKLAKAADDIITAQRRKREALGVAEDDAVTVALTVMSQNVEALELDANALEPTMPKTIRKMVGRKIVEVPNPLYRPQDR